MITVSAGNAAAAVAYGCALDGIDCLVVMWQGSSELKAAAARGYGATVDREAPGPGGGVRATRGAARLDWAGFRPSIRRPGRHRGTLEPRPRDPGGRSGDGCGRRARRWRRPRRGVAVGGARRPGRRLSSRRARRALRDGPGRRPSGPRAAEVARRCPECADRGRALPRAFAGSAASSRCLVTEDDIRAGFRFLYERAKLAAEPGAAAGVGALLAGKVPEVEGKTVAVVVSGGNVAARNRCCYPKVRMKPDIHPEYVLATVRCSCGDEFQTRSTKPELHVEICSECHPFYTGKQKLLDTGGRVERFQRRLEKAGRGQRRPRRA